MCLFRSYYTLRKLRPVDAKWVSADYTAVVSGEVTWPNGRLEIYIQPHPIIRHLTFSQTMEALDDVRHSSPMSSEFYVEAVAYQQAAIEELERQAFSVQAMHPMKEKRARLRVAARYIKNGTVKFPQHGCEQLPTQLLGFGSEKHDDAVDALVYLILGVAGDGIEEPKVHTTCNGRRKRRVCIPAWS